MNIIIEVITEGIAYIFMKVIFKGIKMVGLFIMKIFTLNKYSFAELKSKNKSLPYLIGIAAIVGIIYLLLSID